MQPAAPVSVNHEYMTKRLHILVVEDNAGDFILIEQMLLEIRDFQKEILHVTTLGGAIDLMEQQRCDVILLDLSLPDSYGIDSFHRLSKLFPQTPVIIMSGLNDTRFANEAVKQGALSVKRAWNCFAKARKRTAFCSRTTRFRCTFGRRIL
jgi:DNA-binding NtrC family response regulator